MWLSSQATPRVDGEVRSAADAVSFLASSPAQDGLAAHRQIPRKAKANRTNRPAQSFIRISLPCEADAPAVRVEVCARDHRKVTRKRELHVESVYHRGVVALASSPALFVWIATGALAVALATLWAWPEWWQSGPRGVLVILATLTIAAAACVVRLAPLGTRIWLDPSETPLMLRNDPSRDVYELATRRFGNDDTYVVAVETTDLFTAAHLAMLRDLERSIARHPLVRRTESIVTASDFRFDPASDRLDVGDFIHEIPDDPVALSALRRRALADPVYPKHLIAEDGGSAAINVSLRHGVNDRDLVSGALDEAIQAWAASAEAPGRSFYFSGRPHVKSQAYHIMVSDLLRLIPLAVLVAAGVIFALTRSWRSVLLPLAASLCATLWTFAALAITDVALNLVTIVLGPMLISLGGLYGIHVIGRYDIECQLGGPPAAVALRTLRYTRLPVLIAGLTTCFGFGALLLAGTPATSELGLFALFGISCLTFLSLSGIPACLALLPLPNAATHPATSGAASTGIERALELPIRAVRGAPGGLLIAWAMMSVAALSLVPHTVVDTDYLTFFDRDTPVRRDFEAINRLLVGPVPLYVTFLGKAEGTFRDPATLRALAATEARLAALPGVNKTLSMVAPIRKLNRHLEGDDPAEERIPDSREEVSDAVFLVPKAELRRFASSNHRAANIVVRTGEQGSRALRALEREIRGVLDDREASLADTDADVTGNALVLNRSADRIALDQFRCVGFATAAIFILLSLGLRSPRLGFLAMVPNVVPVVIFFGALGGGAASLSLPTGLIGSLSLGVAIDDTVHLIVGYRRQRNQGLSPEAAIEIVLRQIGRPIVITSLMLIAGFLTISLSGFASMREFGQFCALTMAICLACDLSLLPALLVKMRA